MAQESQSVVPRQIDEGTYEQHRYLEWFPDHLISSKMDKRNYVQMTEKWRVHTVIQKLLHHTQLHQNGGCGGKKSQKRLSLFVTRRFALQDWVVLPSQFFG